LCRSDFQDFLATFSIHKAIFAVTPKIPTGISIARKKIVLIFVAMIALLNLMLGVGVAVVVSHDTLEIKSMLAKLPIAYFKRKFAAELEQHAAEHSAEHAETHPAAETSPHSEIPNALDIPATWAERLKGEQIQPCTPLEAVLCCLRLQLTSYQPTLTKFECDLRLLGNAPAKEALVPHLTQLKTSVEAWKSWINETTAWMNEHPAAVEQESAAATELEEKLLDRLTHTKNILRLAASCVDEAKTEAVLRALQNEINRDLEGIHALFDFTLNYLAVAFSQDSRVSLLPESWQHDGETNMPNRCGLETLAREWRTNDPQQKRLLSGLIVECDRLGKINERFGTAQGDRIFTTFAKLVYDITRNERGDRAARFSGSTIMVLLADTGAAGARCAAERIRQSVEATTFQLGQEELTLVANCAVTEFMLDDPLAEVLQRLQEGIKEAKKAGRNRTAIDEGDGPKVFEALPMTVKGRVVKVAEIGTSETPAEEATAVEAHA
jgi:diguanylate cyclase (GGDEF)-like protein